VTAFYPVYLDLRGRRCVVIGAGTIAQHKIHGLLESGARVTVISPEASSGLEDLADAGQLEILWRPYRRGDLAGAFLAIAATDDHAVNGEAWEEAQARGIPFNSVDDLPRCSFIAPAIHRQGDITITVSTGGKAPALAVRLRDRIAALVTPEYGKLTRLLGGLRSEIAGRIRDFKTRTRAWYRIVDSDAVEFLRRGDEDGAVARVRELLDETVRTGHVYLVGAGPGDPGLITVRGREVLALADVVVYDRLVHPALLEHAPKRAERVFVGKGVDGPSTPQEQINELLTSLALAGRTVVRLKGGDPFVFGRGAEEAAECRAADVPFEVVPGISSAIAAPEAAGIPVTHREYSSGFAVVAGHECEGESDLDWSALARMPTLVVLMGLGRLSRIVENLAAAGADPSVPAAVVANGTLHSQRVIVGTLKTIVDAVAAARLDPPATLVVGNVVRVRELLTTAVLGDRSSGIGKPALIECSESRTPNPDHRVVSASGSGL
jgi:uroporphyrin-III C-methyltransferase/precorrin-2 dehydrogenase/sirohydrochlorin ferrochelatase